MRMDTGMCEYGRGNHTCAHTCTRTVPSEVRCAVIKLNLGVQLLIMWIIWVKLVANAFHETTPRLYTEPTGFAGVRPRVIRSQVQAVL